MNDWLDQVRQYLMDASAAEQGPNSSTDVSTTDFVGPVQPLGPEYRPDLMSSPPSRGSVELSIGDLEAPQPQQAQPPQQVQRPPPPPQVQQSAPAPQPEQPLEPAPRDDSLFYAGLKGAQGYINDMNKGLGIGGNTAFFDAKIAQEQQKQKDWRERLATKLKQTFEQEQQDRRLRSEEGIHDADRLSREAEGQLGRESRERISGNQLESQRLSREQAREQFLASQRQAERHFQTTTAETRANRADLKASRDADDARSVVNNLPKPETLAAAAQVEKLLASGRPPPGFGKIANAMRTLGVPLGQFGENAQQILRMANLTPEEQVQWNDAFTLTMMNAFDLGGKALTAGEKDPVELMAGIRGGVDPAVLMHGLNRIAQSQKQKVKQWYLTGTPGTQAKLRQMGYSPTLWGGAPDDDELTYQGGL